MRGSEERHCSSPSPARDHRDITRPHEIEPTELKRHNAPTTVDGEQPRMGGGVAEAKASTRLKRAARPVLRAWCPQGRGVPRLLPSARRCPD
jgi:hypothetical protein